MDPEENEAFIKSITRKAYQNKKPLDWFEELYSASISDQVTIPWGNKAPNPHLVSWWEGNQVQEKSKTLVIGCGLGDDAEFLSSKGLDVDAFDLSSTAIHLAKTRFKDSKVNYFQSDLFHLNRNMINAYDFIFEAYTLQAMPIDFRANAITIIPNLLNPSGSLLVICRGRNEEDEINQLPFPLSKFELEKFKKSLTEMKFEDFMDGPKRRFRILYQR
jgi:2-polyprenyl-3-methyl-5-hydroxy-6-metoxy-1,4-benzoquinol methylase